MSEPTYEGLTLEQWDNFSSEQKSSYLEGWSREQKKELLQFMNGQRKAKKAILLKEVADQDIGYFEEAKTRALQELANPTATKDVRALNSTEVVTTFLMSVRKFYTTRTDKNSELWMYLDGIYVPHGMTYIEEVCREIYGSAYTTFLVKLVVDKIRANGTYIDQEQFFASTPPHKLVCKNCVINLETLEVEDFNSSEIFFNRIPVIYDPNKDCLEIKKFLNSVVKDESDVRVLQELFGFSLYKEYFLEKAFMFFGGGRNGKSKTLDLVRSLVGRENTSAVSLQQLEDDQYSIAQLHNKMVNIGGDISNKTLKETNIFKGLTGRTPQQANRKNLNHLNFVNYAKMIFSANELPASLDDSEGFWERWEMIDFPYTFLPQDEFNKYTEKEREEKGIKLQDPHIIKNIVSDDELSGLLNYAIEGLRRIKELNDFSSGRSKKEIKLTWHRRSNSFFAFAMENLEQDFSSRIIKNDLKRAYSDYLKETNSRGKSDKMIKHILNEKYGSGDARIKFGDDQHHCWEGIRFKEQDVVMNNLGEYYISRPKGHKKKTSSGYVGLLGELYDVINSKGSEGIHESELSELTGQPEENIQNLLKVLAYKGSILEKKREIWAVNA